ncbi:hypothetical protein L1999_15770 [Neobacillus drentensis]|uniref:hypothetical protein n=1 Tax=Neobacillus drentensis TaxID=220684 RepID=UPI001F1F8BC0|nr:hypothetical protein [Neobacillus drentensis]ULT54617.1 hypothetical protein L1999_15770 [Neobacillus drentensis]
MGLEKFSAALDLLKGFQVNLYVGEDIFKGKLIGVETDHVVLETENNYIFYYNIDKIQAILKNTKQFRPENASVEFQKTQSLMELLRSFQYSWVTILSINKQSFYGVLSEIDEDFVTLINGEERILIKVAQISNILKGVIKEEKQEKNEQEKTESKNETNNQDKESKESSEAKDSKKKTETVQSKESNEVKDSKKKTETDHSKESNEVKDSKKKTETDQSKESNEVKDSKEKTNKSKEKVKDHFSNHSPKEYKTETKASDKKSKSPSTSEKFEIKMEAESSEVTVPNQMVVWSGSYKHEPSLLDDPSAKGNMFLDEFEPMQMFKSEIKVPINELPHREHKKGEAMGSKSTTTSPASKKEKKHEKPQETVNAVSKKTETYSQEKVYNDTNKVWKQTNQETRGFFFNGEPASRSQERTFPFAGWPSNNKRTFRF